jgi:chemotaxis protein CheD
MTQPAQALKQHAVIQGEYRIASGPAEVLTTVLGSCVSICMTDAMAGVGGMNHFLLPGDPDRPQSEARYGINAMELLINGLLKAGARHGRLQAKVFGGANATGSRFPVGKANVDFAFWFLRNEGIPCIGQDVGGRHARRLRFWPHSGLAQLMLLPNADLPEELPPAAARRTAAPPEAGEPDLFL